MFSKVFDIIISDIMMPEIDRFTFAKSVRKLNRDIPILFMKARDDFSAKEQGFMVGIDDYMVKLVLLPELLLHINVLLRRAKKDEFNLGDKICECMLQFQDKWEEKHLEIDADIKENVIVRRDRELLSLVWNNLISNAIKFTPNKDQIKISLSTDDENVIFSIRDSGCGISKENQSYIFEKFYQGDTSHKTLGNGLGLSLVKRVIYIMNGHISVISKKDEGSTFSVTLKKNI